MRPYDAIVVGKGLIGSAAARYLSAAGLDTAVIGPDEPAPGAPADVYASHYDQGRLTRRIGRSPAWSWIADRAIAGYRDLEARSGIPFYHPVGLLIVDAPGVPGGPLRATAAMAAELGLPHTYYPPGDDGWRTVTPHFAFPATHWVLHEPAPAGYINPRSLVAAQRTLAATQGATIVPAVATAVTPAADHVAVRTTDGATYRATRVLIAAGAFSNFHDLLPAPIALTPKTETIVLGEVSAATAAQLAGLPTLIYRIEDPAISDIYLAPPIRYPDGRFYIKLGANTVADTHPTTLAAMRAWFQRGDSDACWPAMAGALRALLPEVAFKRVVSRRCIICRTPSGYPTIDRVADRVFVAAGGNGGGAKGSDTLGWLAAGMMLGEAWPAALPRDMFRAG